MNNYLFELTEDEEVKYKLRKYTNYFILQDKYDELEKLLKDLKKMDRTTVKGKQRTHLNSMYECAEYEIPRIISIKELLDEIKEVDIEEYAEKHTEWGKDKIRNIIHELKIIMATIEKILIECRELIYFLYDNVYGINEVTYLTQKDILDLCKMYQLSEIIEQLGRTIDSQYLDIDFSELSDEVLSKHFTLDYQEEIKDICEELRIDILNFIGFWIRYDFLYTYNEVQDMTGFFLQIINANNSDTSYIEKCIKTFDKNEYIEFLKETPLDYLEYLKEFGKYDEYLEYKSKINKADIEDK